MTPGGKTAGPVRHRLIAALALAALALSALGRPVLAEPFTLAAVEAKVARDYADVRHMPTEALARLLESDKAGEVLLLDVREPAEYAVSHLPGAVRVDPGIWRWTFMRRFAEKAKGKIVVFYCSVGVRSSKLASAFGKALRQAGARALYNLRGGIFAWHNEGRRLVDARGETDFVHPYDSHWGRLLTRRSLARTRPRIGS